MTEDRELLRRYVEESSEPAFAELVNRHLGLVYFGALRRTKRHDLAAEVTQAVFIRLASNAASLRWHPTLSGWLFTVVRNTAINVCVAEERRRRRDQQIFQMQETISEAHVVEESNRVQPLLHEALDSLPEADRTAVLLRFFERRAFSDIGRALQVTEDAARKRVERALEMLRKVLAARGVTSTTAAMSIALTAEAASVPPVTLAASVLKLIATGADTISASTAGGVLSIMSKLKTGMVVVVALGTTVVTGVGVISHYKDAVPASRPTIVAANNRPLLTNTDSPAENIVAQVSLAPVQSLSQDLEGNQSVVQPATREELLTRRLKARALKNEGRFSEALAEYLWVFDSGRLLRLADRRVGLLTEIAALGAHYPQARDALRERIALAAKLLENSPGDEEALKDLVALNRVLEQEDRTIALYDSLSSADPMRKKLAAELFEPLVNAGRYQDAMVGTTYARIARSFDNRSAHDTGSQAWRNLVVQKTLNEIEALAGIGNIEHAAELSKKLLSYSNDELTKEMLRRALARAGKSGSIEIK